MIELEFDDAQQAIATAVQQLCEDRCTADHVRAASGDFPRAMWNELAALGMLAIGTPEGDGGALEMVAAVEALGASVFPGPIVETFLATQVLDGADREAVIEGRAVVSAGSPPLLPWAPYADVFLEVASDEVFKASVSGEIERVSTLGGETWGRVELKREASLPRARHGRVTADIALAAYQSSAGLELVLAASRHASMRTQFGKAIGEFQAVAHPLADCHMNLIAARLLARNSAFLFDDAPDVGDAKPDAAHVLASGATLSANRAALEAVHVCHQVFGANGITLEGPVFHMSRRIRQLASSGPDVRSRDALLDNMGFSPSAHEARS